MPFEGHPYAHMFEATFIPFPADQNGAALGDLSDVEAGSRERQGGGAQWRYISGR
jgi:hypothetical protein